MTSKKRRSRSRRPGPPTGETRPVSTRSTRSHRRGHAKLEVRADGEFTEPPSTPRELFDALPPLPGLRTEIIDGSLIVSAVDTPEHGRMAMRLYRLLLEEIEKNDWDGFTGNVDVCIEGPRDPVEPDFVLAPADCPRWGERELLSSGLIMAAEVVSPGSVEQDRVAKPRIYAGGGVPMMLLIDLVASPPAVTVFSDPREGVYQAVGKVPMGTSLYLPHPIDLDVDTAVFLPQPV
ncbi:Uma2 family endonuclease [Sinosporangium album]|nr:Uma2 family endonuclease [Sinosporangium album]